MRLPDRVGQGNPLTMVQQKQCCFGILQELKTLSLSLAVVDRAGGITDQERLCRLPTSSASGSFEPRRALAVWTKARPAVVAVRWDWWPWSAFRLTVWTGLTDWETGWVHWNAATHDSWLWQQRCGGLTAGPAVCPNGRPLTTRNIGTLGPVQFTAACRRGHLKTHPATTAGHGLPRPPPP